MARHEFTIAVDVDENALREHVAQHGDARYPIVADPKDFAWVDLEAALETGIADEVEITDWVQRLS